MNTSSLAAGSRREFLKSSTTAATVALAAPGLILRETAFAANSDTLKVGLVGCGGRGTGAAGNALTADSNCILTAVGDAFPEPTAAAVNGLKQQFGNRVDVPPDRQFVGLDAYQKVINSGVDVVLLATPPGFRPLHLRAAVEAGKQIFCEKPMATDPAGVRHVLESVKISKQKKLNLVSGFCWRSDFPRRAFYEQIHAGTLGEVKAVYCTYLTGPVKPMPSPNRRPAGMGDLEWQMRNWYNFTWLSGDGLVEQCIHSVDKLAWAFQDQPPVRCSATGGRMTPNYEGNIYDHITVVYEYENGARGVVAQRQIPGCHNDNSDFVLGTRGNGVSGWGDPTIRGEKNWRYRSEKKVDMYVVEHMELFQNIRNGSIRNDGDWMVSSTMMGVMGRLAAYSGKQITWEEALQSKEKLAPDTFSWDMKLPIQPLAVPGRYMA